MGKSTAAAMLETMKIPTHDSDVAAHHFLHNDEQTRVALAAQFPYFEYSEIYGKKNKNGIRPFDRKKLGKLVFEKPEEREKLEKILHPQVQKAQNEFIRKHRNMGADIVALDIPLLFETGADQRVDYTITISAPAFIQKTRVLSRPNMNEEKFDNILKTQMSDAEKCARADFVVPSGLGKAHMMKELKKIIVDLRNPDDNEEEMELEGRHE